MHCETVELAAGTPGTRHTLKALHYGTPGARPKAYIQAALHADEIPALLVAQLLRQRLDELEAAGRIVGEVILVPYANPMGLGQDVLGRLQGRFHLRDGINFNRQIPDLSHAAAEAVAGRLGDDAAANTLLLRDALRSLAARLTAQQPVDDLKNRLLGWAIDADIVLDLHCDSEAVMHVYGLTPQAEMCAELGALLGAQAILLATESGDSPFDEACSRPWFVARQRHPDKPLPLACFSVTVELRGEADTDDALSGQDADAIVEFLVRRGVLAGSPADLPAAQCLPTPLASSEPVTATCSGVVVFQRQPGDRVSAGALIAEVVDIDSGERHPLHAQSAGLLYARSATRWATPGTRLAKIAGTALARTGKLLGP